LRNDGWTTHGDVVSGDFGSEPTHRGIETCITQLVAAGYLRNRHVAGTRELGLRVRAVRALQHARRIHPDDDVPLPPPHNMNGDLGGTRWPYTSPWTT
jgi:hypothetical protein